MAVTYIATSRRVLPILTSLSEIWPVDCQFVEIEGHFQPLVGGHLTRAGLESEGTLLPSLN